MILLIVLYKETEESLNTHEKSMERYSIVYRQSLGPNRLPLSECPDDRGPREVIYIYMYIYTLKKVGEHPDQFQAIFSLA